LGDGRLPLVVAPRQVLNEIRDHLAEQRLEMGGLLIGGVYSLEGSDSRFVVSIEDHARGEDFDATGVSLRLNSGV
jgi:hypothetical protein